MEEFEERRQDEAPRETQDGDDRAPAPGNEAPRFGGQGDFRARRRGRRGRGGGGGGGGQRFGGAPRGPGFAGPRPGGANMPPRDDEESSQTRELAAYERRQQQRGRPQFRGPGWVAGARPTGAPAPFRPQGGGGGFRPAGRPQRGPRRPGSGPTYSEQIRRVTAGPRAMAAPSHEAGEPIAGARAVVEAIRAGRQIKRLFVSNERGTRTGPVNELITEAQQRRIFVRFVDPLEIQRLSPIENHQGVVAIVEGKAGVELDELLLHLETSQTPLVLIIDSLQDPQNFGVLLRSAEGTGVDGVVIPRHRAVGLTPAVAKTSAGASEHLMIADVANLRQAIDALKEKGVWVVGTDENGDLLYDEVDYRGPTAIVVGGEAEGIRRLVLEGCDQVVRIPMEGHVASLNAAAAGTIVLYEALRQRRRNAAPADTRTPPPPRPEPLIPQEEDMGEELADAENAAEAEAIEPRDDASLDERDTPAEITPAENAEETMSVDDSEAAADDDVAPPSEDDAPAAPKRAPRAKKATSTRKTAAKRTTRKKTSD